MTSRSDAFSVTKMGMNEASSNPITAAELLRRRKKRKVHNDNGLDDRTNDNNDCVNDSEIITIDKPSGIPKEDDLDDAIKQLEAKLGNGNKNDSDDDDDNSSESSSYNDPENGKEVTNNADKLILSSSLNDDRIDSLPESYLPKTKRRYLKGIDSSTGGDEEVVTTKNKKTSKRKRSETNNTNNNNDDHEVAEEIKSAVTKILGNYVPRSVERLPFYCRCCAMQCESEESFLSHRETVFHQTAVEMERKLSYCKLCRKQLTSPVQLKEHLKSKPHQQRFDMLRSRQQPKQRPHQQQQRSPHQQQQQRPSHHQQRAPHQRNNR